jgi:hypothetical protein
VEERRRDREVTAQEDVRDFTRALTVLTFVQATLAALGLGLTYMAAKAAQKAASVATAALHMADRAYVSSVNWTLTDFAKDKRPVVHFVIQNVGRTPGQIVGTKAIAMFDVQVMEGEPTLQTRL